LGDCFCYENGLPFVLKRKEKVDWYGGMERNHRSQTGPSPYIHIRGDMGLGHSVELVQVPMSGISFSFRVLEYVALAQRENTNS